MSNEIKDLKKIYEDIKIPSNLDKIVDDALINGQIKKKNRSWIKRTTIAASILGGMVIGANTMPVLANSTANVPVLGKLVKIIQFNNGKNYGGKITDGVDVNCIKLKEDKNSQSIFISFNKKNSSNIAPNYKVDYKENPYTMTFSISGARELNAEKYFNDLKKSKYISDIYKVITTDDSMIRFTIVFNKPIKYEIQEYKEPSYIKINLKEDSIKDKTMYSVRTTSKPFGEEISNIEEILCKEDVRVIKDLNGTFCVEAGIYKSLKDAENKLKEIQSKYGSQLGLFIEERNGMDKANPFN